MAKPGFIDLPSNERMRILYEDRSVLAVDKPWGWMLSPTDWSRTSRNLQSWLEASMRTGEFWARSRGIKYIRFVHRLDAETTGVLLLARSLGALRALSQLFETRSVEKRYWAVVSGVPKRSEWTCDLRLGLAKRGCVKVDAARGKLAETHFKVLDTREKTTLVEARPLTGRTHQIRVHLLACGHPVLNDPLYSPDDSPRTEHLALRAVRLHYTDPFTRKTVSINAPIAEFLRSYGYEQRNPEEFHGPRRT
jgi:RluA family pseudouridine synthase